MWTKTSIEKEARKRADLAGIPMEVVKPFVEAETVKYAIRLDYEINEHHLDLAEILYFTDCDAVWCRLNIRHPWIRLFVLDDRVCPRSQRDAVEVAIMTVFGVRPGLSEERQEFYASHLHHISARLWTAAEIMFVPDPKTGMIEDGGEEE